MNSKSFLATSIVSILLVGASVSTPARAMALRSGKDPSSAKSSSPSQSKKKNKLEKSTLAVENGTKDTGKTVGKAGENGAEAVTKGSEKSVKAAAAGTKAVTKAGVKSTKKTGKAAAGASKKIGSVFK